MIAGLRISEDDLSGPEIAVLRVVGSSVWKSLSPTPTSAPVSALSRVDLPALV